VVLMLHSGQGHTALPGVGHFMLRRVRKWNRFVEDSVSDIFGLTANKGAPTEGNP